MDVFDPDPRYFTEWERMEDEYRASLEHAEEERREKLLRGEPFFNYSDPDLARDIARGK